MAFLKLKTSRYDIAGTVVGKRCVVAPHCNCSTIIDVPNVCSGLSLSVPSEAYLTLSGLGIPCTLPSIIPQSLLDYQNSTTYASAAENKSYLMQGQVTGLSGPGEVVFIYSTNLSGVGYGDLVASGVANFNGYLAQTDVSGTIELGPNDPANSYKVYVTASCLILCLNEEFGYPLGIYASGGIASVIVIDDYTASNGAGGTTSLGSAIIIGGNGFPGSTLSCGQTTSSGVLQQNAIYALMEFDPSCLCGSNITMELTP